MLHVELSNQYNVEVDSATKLLDQVEVALPEEDVEKRIARKSLYLSAVVVRK